MKKCNQALIPKAILLFPPINFTLTFLKKNTDKFILDIVDDYRIKINLFAISPNHAIKVFQQKYPEAKDIYVIQDLFKGNK